MKQAKIKMGIAEDHTMVREALAHFMELHFQVKVIISVENGKELLLRLKKHRPDIVLLDIEMPVMNGVETLKILSRKYPKIKVIILTMHRESVMVGDLIKMGALGFLYKGCDEKDLQNAISFAMRNEIFISKKIYNIKKDIHAKEIPDKTVVLTNREKEILNMIAQGLESKEIGIALGLSRKTVERHKSNLFQKTGTRKMMNLVVYGIKAGLIVL